MILLFVFQDSLERIFAVVSELCEKESCFRDETSAALKFLSNLCLTSQYLSTVVSSTVLRATVALLLRSDSIPTREQVTTYLPISLLFAHKKACIHF